MYKAALLLLGLLAAAGASAQTTPATPYRFSADIKASQQGEAPARNQFAAWDYSRIGEHQAALAAWDQDFGGRQTLAPADSQAFAASRPTDAVKYILEQAHTARVVIINEAHHNARHRVFAASLLPRLARLGFRYFGAEGIDAADSLLNQRKYPVLRSGFYVTEPCYGNLLRSAASAGYRLFGYDAMPAGGPAARELAQAQNIQKVLAADPKARVVIYCGFDHVNEGPRGMYGQPAMAARLRELTGIDPLTIDQTQLSESSVPTAGQPLYHRLQAQGSSVFVNVQEKGLHLVHAGKTADLSVYHPPTRYKAGRPDWLLTPGKKLVPVASKVNIAFPCLVQAYPVGEDASQAVPVDVVELESAQDTKALVLARGAYMVLIRNRQGQTQTLTLNP